ncbi:hypothetical protein [Archangium violaceum]|uniref:hypothetical protein n=1 Tax=Archangium violaceum TaxID=83451 RepID=UPI001269BC21|nr:hypothetical protein [Archangium violaceum]
MRLRAVLRFRVPLQSVRYLFKHLGAAHTLDELMMAACGWAAERMAHATREDCIEAILRQKPRALSSSRSLKHRKVLADLSLPTRAPRHARCTRICAGLRRMHRGSDRAVI